MKRLLAVLFLYVSTLMAQGPNTFTFPGNGVPPGGANKCAFMQLWNDRVNGHYYFCDARTGTWTDLTAGGGGVPGGANTQVQFNNAGAFGGSSKFTWAAHPVSSTDGVYIGDPLSSFNAFDQATATAINFLMCKNPNSPTVTQTCNVSLAEYSNVSGNFQGAHYFQGTSTNSAGSMPFLYGGYAEADTFSTGTGTVALATGLGTTTENHSGTTDLQAGVTVHNLVDVGATSTSVAGFLYRQNSMLGTTTNNYGFYSVDVTGATNNYAIYTNAGRVRLGDVTTIGSTAPAPNNLLLLKGAGTGLLSLGQLSDATGFNGLVFNNTALASTNYSIASDNTDTRYNVATGNKHRFLVNNVDRTWFDVNGLSFFGSTSGGASIDVAAVAGSPNRILLPVATGGAGTFLQTDGNNPQQTSWVAAVTSVTASQPLSSSGGTTPALSYTAPASTTFWLEDFLVTQSGSTAPAGWTAFATGTGTLSYVTSAGHPGIVRTSSGATVSSKEALSSGGAAGNNTVFLSTENFDITFSARPSVTGATKPDHMVCLSGDTASSTNLPYTDAFCAEVLSADAPYDWYMVNRRASTPSRFDTGTAVTNGTWYTLRLYRVDSNTVGLSVNGGNTYCITSAGSLPAACTNGNTSVTLYSGGVRPISQVRNNTAATTETLDLDYVRLLITGLSR